MRKSICSLIFLSFLGVPALSQAAMLKGRVVLVGTHDQTTQAEGVDVTLQETGDTVRTKAQGLFRLFIPEIFKAGEQITLLVDKEGYHIQYPLDGEAFIPADLSKDLVEIRLLPVGSKKFWSEDRIEKFIADTAEKVKKQVRPKGRPEDIDFARAIKDWAAEYGFSAQQAKAQIDKWITEVKIKEDDLRKLGLAAFAEKKFGKAESLFKQSADAKIKNLNAVKAQEKSLTNEIISDYRLAGDAAYNNYEFENAINNYQKALSFVVKETRPLLWAEIQIEIGNACGRKGIRAESHNAHEFLKKSISANRKALKVYTRDYLPQLWAGTQNNLGNTLQDQGTRTDGEQGKTLLTEAVAGYRKALKVYTRDYLPQNWAATQNNLGLALQEQGIRTDGEPGNTLLAEAVTAYRNALKIHTRVQLPQNWAMTQSNLGSALLERGFRTGGELGKTLLAEAVTANRNALKIHTREYLPQQWAMSQNNLGNALKRQGTRTGGELGKTLLAEAVTAYRNALKVYTRVQLPQNWAITQSNLGSALKHQGMRTGGEQGKTLLAEAVTAYRNALHIFEVAQMSWHVGIVKKNIAEAMEKLSANIEGY